MKVYIAAPYAARAQVRYYASGLARIGITVTSSWLNEQHEINSGTVGAAVTLSTEEAADHAATDLTDIARSDLLVVLTEAHADMLGGTGTSGGRHVETGYAIALGKPVIVVGEPENIFHRLGRACTLVPNWHEAVIELAARRLGGSERLTEVKP